MVYKFVQDLVFDLAFFLNPYSQLEFGTVSLKHCRQRMQAILYFVSYMQEPMVDMSREIESHF